MRAGYQTLTAYGSSDNFNITGDCSGTATFTAGAAAAASFNGVSGYSVTSTSSMTLTNCSPSSVSETGTNYFDANYDVLGSSSPGAYEIVRMPPTRLPVTMSVGDSGTYATLDLYRDSTKADYIGSRVLSYEVTRETASTATVSLIVKLYGASNALALTQQSRYSVDEAGIWRATSIDVEYEATPSSPSAHLVYTVR